MLATVLLTTALHCVSAFALSVATEQLPLSSQVDVDSVQHTAGTYKKVTHDGIFDHVAVASLPDYQLRVQSSKSLCDPSVKQYSGYLDVSRKKHLFFWFFESRKDPHKAPLAVWMNGGPGGSSALGLTMENGPCSVQPGGNSTAWNPYAWNEVANMFYLDQPAGVGYSYSTASHVIDSTKDAAKDFYAFLQLFLARFPEYSQLPFHVLSESYGGQYAPNFASYINQQNKIHRNTLGSTTHIPVNLESVLIVNGMVSPRIQSEMVPEYACRGPYAFWDNDGEHCALLRSRVPRLRQLFKMCEDFETTLTCLPAVIFAFGSMNEGFEKLGLNVYDVRRNCTHPPLCYEEMEWAQDYMNRTDVKTALGVPSRHNYSMISWEINSAFFLAGDVHNDASPMIRELVEDGIRVLNLAGDADFACNFMGAFEWMHQLENPYAAEFRSMKNTVWKNKLGKAVGEVRAAGDSGGKTAGKYTWLRVYEAGHMVPHDQPEVSLEFFQRWVKNQPIVDVV